MWLGTPFLPLSVKMDHELLCQKLVEKCKQEAKQLAEITATRRTVHWTHPNFTSFCVSVEHILSHGVKRRYQCSKPKQTTASGRILHDLGKTFPLAQQLYDKCFRSARGMAEKEDYMVVRECSLAERKILWIRAALIEGKLQGIIERLTVNPKQFYTESSVLCHPVYGEIFMYLLDGPCSIRFSRLKTSDSSISNPSPAEIVHRHNQVLSISVSNNQQEVSSTSMATEQAWDHVRSLYQNTASHCLFGKNNVLVHPSGFKEPIQGYLTLQLVVTTLMLKWIPNALLRDSSNSRSSLWDHVLSVDIVGQVAHIHCHRQPGKAADLIMIGYDGIAFPPILFPHQPSIFMFLECLENSLLPQGCLEPPLWYLKKNNKANKSQLESLATKPASRPPPVDQIPLEEQGEWFEGMEVWNQVFRIRHGSKQQNGEPQDSESVIQATPPLTHPLPLNLEPYSSVHQPLELYDSSSDSDAVESPLIVSVEKPGSLARRDWEKFQSKVSKQLLARYFYSWLSYCRHMHKVRMSVAHMVTSQMITDDDPCHKCHTLSIATWDAFIETGNMQRWPELIKTIYLKGVQHEARPKVWPYLLGLYPPDSSTEEREAIDQLSCSDYHRVCSEWTKVEMMQKAMENKVVRRYPLTAQDNEEADGVASSKDTGGKVHGKSVVANSENLDVDVHFELHAQSQHGSQSDVSSRSSPSLSTISPNESRDSSPLVNTSCDTSHGDSVPQNSELPLPSDSSNISSCDNHAFSDKENTCNQISNSSIVHVTSHDPALVRRSPELDAKGRLFVDELIKINKDIPRCDRDYKFFKDQANLIKLQNIVCSYVWTHMTEGYSQGMCDLVAPLLVVLNDEVLTYACYLRLMDTAIKLFPPNTGMNTRLNNVQSLLQVLEPDYFQYLSDRPMGDGLFYCYRWFLVTFKREIAYEDVFRLWETIWASRRCVSNNFEEFFALGIMMQFKTAIMDAHLDPSDILNLFTDLAEKRSIDCADTITIAQRIIHDLQAALTKK